MSLPQTRERASASDIGENGARSPHGARPLRRGGGRCAGGLGRSEPRPLRGRLRRRDRHLARGGPRARRADAAARPTGHHRPAAGRDPGRQLGSRSALAGSTGRALSARSCATRHDRRRRPTRRADALAAHRHGDQSAAHRQGEAGRGERLGLRHRPALPVRLPRRRVFAAGEPPAVAGAPGPRSPSPRSRSSPWCCARWASCAATSAR
jgi:hypothetical protein